MGARFDKWLARPSTLRFLRQLVGPESTVARTKKPRWNTPPKRHVRNYSTAQAAPISHTLEHEPRNRNASAVDAASIETLHEQRERVAKELGLRIPQESQYDAPADRIRSVPSSTSYSDLLYSETRVRDLSSVRGLLIDEPANHDNLAAWRRILNYRQRTDGYRGVVDVWEGMRRRGINLPLEGKLADALWNTFLYAAIDAKDQRTTSPERLLHHIFEHAKFLKDSGSGQRRDFHKTIVGRYLRHVPRKKSRNIEGPEYEWHQKACEAGFCDAQSLAFLVMDVLKSSQPKLAFARWQRLYQHDRSYYGIDVESQHGMYDLCMPLLILHAADDPALIISWHNFFTSNKDMPSPKLASTQSINYLLGNNPPHEADADTSKFSLAEFVATMKEDRGDAQPSTSPILSRAYMSGLVGDVHGIKPKTISDKFCARMFATQAFSLETSIRGLALLGAETLGPVALRELAVRAVTLDMLKKRLADVKSAGIAISSSTYAHILKVVASNSQNDLFHTLLASDQHPESYDDHYTQETLLDNFLQAEDWTSAHLTLIGLSQDDPAKAARAWNRLLQHYIKSENHTEVLRIFSHMRSEQMIITARSLNFLTKYMLPPRSPSKRPQVSTSSPETHTTDFVVNAHMYAVSQGRQFDAHRWIEMLKRYGMVGNVEGLERLANWLVAHYRRRVIIGEYVRRDGKIYYSSADDSLAKIFNPAMLRAIIIWAFRHEVRQNKLPTSPDESSLSEHEQTSKSSWTRGISLLLHLKRLRVDVRTKDVRRAVTQILWTLFGPAVSNRRINTELMLRNQETILEYVNDANTAWDELLFDLDSKSTDRGFVTKEAHVIHAVFGDQRLADKKTGTWVDVEAWATAVDNGEWEESSRSISDRRDAWLQSPFRFQEDYAKKGQRRIASRKQIPPHLQQRDVQQHSTTAQVNPPPHLQPAAQPSNWRPLPSQPDTPGRP